MECPDSGVFCVNKSDIPFVTLGLYHAGEHENKVLKTDGGIIAIAKKHKCKEQVLYYSSHHLSISYRTALVLDKQHETHHQLIPSKQKKQVECMEKIKSIIERHKNTFAMKEDPSLCYIITDNVPSE